MTLETLVIPKPAYNVLRRVTGEIRPDVALSMALKDLIRLRIEAAQAKNEAYEKKYGLTFVQFEQRWQAGQIENALSYPIEQDYLYWEATLTDLNMLQEVAAWAV
jgi:hypothetical protein